MIYISTEGALALVLGAMIIWILNYITKQPPEFEEEREPAPPLQADYTRALMPDADVGLTEKTVVVIGGTTCI